MWTLRISQRMDSPPVKSRTAGDSRGNADLCWPGRYVQRVDVLLWMTKQTTSPKQLLLSIQSNFPTIHWKSFQTTNQWPFQAPKLEVPSIYFSYIRPIKGNIPPILMYQLHCLIVLFFTLKAEQRRQRAQDSGSPGRWWRLVTGLKPWRSMACYPLDIYLDIII